jgi:cytochrome c553
MSYEIFRPRPMDPGRARPEHPTMKILLLRALLAAAVALAVSPAARAADVDAGRVLATRGSATGAPACIACHGPSGQGQAGLGFPRLAGMNADYLLRQLSDFRAQTRVNPVMAPIAKMLTAADQQHVAAYYASLPARPEGPAAAPPPAAGAQLAQQGDWDHGIPACAQCHAPSGLGVGAGFPQLAGQSALYLANQLTAWKQGTRKNDPLGLMRQIAAKLSDAQVAAVTAYYAALPPVFTVSKAKP